jgi:hypothetical protein
VSERAGILLRLDPAVRDALARWAADELRSTNAQIDFLLRRALADAGRLPGPSERPRRRASRRAEAGRPARDDDRTGRPRGSSSGRRPGETRP